MKRSFIKILAIIMIIGLYWTGLSAVIGTIAYFNDTEVSQGNSYSAGSLDFSLSDFGDFSPVITLGQPSTRTIKVINNGTLGFQYIIQASEFSGELCDYLNLEANVDGGDPEYTGSLTSFVLSTSTIFSDPDDWVFTLTLPSENSIDPLQEETCQFKFIFNGWQDNLPSEQGFNDTEEILNNVTAGQWAPNLLTPLDNAVINGSYVKQCWTPVSGATKYIYQSCNNNPNVSDCDQRWYVEYPEGTPQFTEACKWAPNVGNATYWWRVKAEIGSYSTSYSNAWKITVDNSHLNQVVINEFLPNPIGDDNAPMPNGEWVELYNNKGEDVDVAGWWLYDESDEGELPITSGNTNTGDTLIRSGGFLVVYRNGDPDFALDNIGGDTVRLYDGEIDTGALIDSHAYAINALGGKSFARVPDGSNTWVDPIPTPGEPNTLGREDMIFEPAFPEPGEGVPEESVIEEVPTDGEEAIGETTTATTTTTTISDSDDLENSTTTSTTVPDQTTISTTTVDFISSPSISTTTIIETPVEESTTTTTTTEPPMDEATTIGEAPTPESSTPVPDTNNETLVIENQPAIEEQPVAVSENSSIGDNSDGSSNDGAVISVDNSGSVSTGDSGASLGE